jgi:transcriptional regulator with XRE-family HTH domain
MDKIESLSTLTYDRFSLLLSHYRMKYGLSQSELGRRAHISPSHIHRLEKGERNPTRMMVERLARALGMQQTDDHFNTLLDAAGYRSEYTSTNYEFEIMRWLNEAYKEANLKTRLEVNPILRFLTEMLVQRNSTERETDDEVQGEFSPSRKEE